MDDISLNFVRGLGAYNSEFACRLEVSGAERVRDAIMVFVRGVDGKESERATRWRRVISDIARSQKKIADQAEEIRKHVAFFSLSHAEYDEIMADTDLVRREARLERFLQEKMQEIRGTLLKSGNLDKQVRRLSSPDIMLAMRKDIDIDRKNITEALSVVLLSDARAQQMVRGALDKQSQAPSFYPSSQPDEPIEIVFEAALREMARVLSLIEEYQREGLSGIHHLENLDRQIAYMLKDAELKNKH